MAVGENREDTATIVRCDISLRKRDSKFSISLQEALEQNSTSNLDGARRLAVGCWLLAVGCNEDCRRRRRRHRQVQGFGIRNLVSLCIFVPQTDRGHVSLLKRCERGNMQVRGLPIQ
jgi:hypothetical protein